MQFTMKMFRVFPLIYLVIVQHHQFSAVITQIIGSTEYRLRLLMLLWLRLRLCAIIIVTIAIEIVRVIVGRGIICRDGRWHGFSHVASSIRCRVTILLAGRQQCVWLWCGRNVIIVQQLWCFRIVLQDIIGWIDKARWYETLLSVTAHNPKPFGIFSIQNCL